MEVGGSVFISKFVCLVLTCDRPYYNARREENARIFEMIRAAGFDIVYLFGNSKITRCIRNDDSSYSLYVPIEDSYDTLSAKMEAAYSYFSLTKCIGILKVDDDTFIHEPECIEGLIEKLKECDYFGVIRYAFPPGDHWPQPTRFKQTEILSKPFKNPDWFIYFGGPFYYISKRVIDTIPLKHLIAPWEDVSVGCVVNTMEPPAKTEYAPWYVTNMISFKDETEPTPNT